MFSKPLLAIIAMQFGVIAWFAIDEYGLLWIEGDNAREARCREDKARIIQAGEDALRMQQAAQAAETARQTQLQETADANHTRALDQALRAAARYRAERLPAPAFGGAPGAARAVPESAGSRVPPNAPAGAELVAIDPADHVACTIDYTYGMSAFDWARGLGD